MRTAVMVVLALTALLSASPTDAQEFRSLTTISVGRHEARGGTVQNRKGLLVDALLARRLGTQAVWRWIVGGGAGGVLGGTTDECVLHSTGACAPKGNYLALNGIVGVGATVGALDVQGAVGPAVIFGGGDTSIGIQSRLDFFPRFSTGIRPGAMIRATIAPSHNQSHQTFIALGLSLQRRR